LRGTLQALQLLAAFFLAILGLAMAFRSADSFALLIGSALGAMGLSFLALLGINLFRRQ
jgi:hypothetical protein